MNRGEKREEIDEEAGKKNNYGRQVELYIKKSYI